MKRYILLIMTLFFALIIFSQPPQMFNYQAAVRNTAGELVTDQSVGIKIEILEGSISGTAIYTESHSALTNEYGILTLAIGNGTTSDDFTAINWGSNDYFIRVSVDIEGGTDYQVMGTSQLLSVPFAMYAEESDYLDGKQAYEFASASHTHSALPDAYGYINKYDINTDNCWNVESVSWSATYERYEITISNVYYSIDDMAFVTIRGDAGICPAGAVARVGSVSGKLLVYIVSSTGTKLDCSFDFVAFAN